MIGWFPVEWFVTAEWLALAALTRSTPPIAVACLIAAAGFGAGGLFRCLRMRRERGNR